jgi:hypothetical protein
MTNLQSALRPELLTNPGPWRLENYSRLAHGGIVMFSFTILKCCVRKKSKSFAFYTGNEAIHRLPFKTVPLKRLKVDDDLKPAPLIPCCTATI